MATTTLQRSYDVAVNLAKAARLRPELEQFHRKLAELFVRKRDWN
jgi:hypothetical protein